MISIECPGGMKRASSPSVETKQVLSGGHLRRPCFVETCKVSDLVFVELSTRDSAITRFFTGQRHQVSPLRRVDVFERLVELRNVATSRQSGTPDVLGLDKLGLDVAPAPKRKAPRRSDALERPGPTVVEVDYDGTELKVLSGVGRSRVWVEFTTKSMKLLLGAVSNALAGVADAQGAAVAENAGADAEATSPDSSDGGGGEDTSLLQTPPKKSEGAHVD